VLIPPHGTTREGKRPRWEHGPYRQIREKLSTEPGNQLSRQRKRTVKQVYGQIKYNRRIDRFHRRGRAAVRSEWRLLMMTHNLTQLHRHRLAAIGA
jgi:hypothetical protein